MVIRTIYGSLHPKESKKVLENLEHAIVEAFRKAKEEL